MIHKADAILSLNPKSEFVISDGELKWLSSEINKPNDKEIDDEVNRLQAEYDAKSYARNRQQNFPNEHDLLVALWEKVIEGRSESADALEVKRQEVKTAHPKPK